MKGKSCEIVVADENGVWKTRTVQRKPADERWDPKNIDWNKGLPWKTEEEDEASAPAIAIRMDGGKMHEEQTTDAKPAVPRNFYKPGIWRPTDTRRGAGDVFLFRSGLSTVGRTPPHVGGGSKSYSRTPTR